VGRKVNVIQDFCIVQKSFGTADIGVNVLKMYRAYFILVSAITALAQCRTHRVLHQDCRAHPVLHQDCILFNTQARMNA